MDPRLVEIFRSCGRSLLERSIKDLDGTIYQGVLKCTWPHWRSFLSYLDRRGSLTRSEISACKIDVGRDDNMEKILSRLDAKGKKVWNLIDYLYNTQNYAALKCFDIHIEAPEPEPEDEFIINEVEDRTQRCNFPPTFKEQPPENIRVYPGQPIKFEPCRAKHAKRYQWFKAVEGGDLLVHENEEYGTFEITDANATHAGTYFCKVFNDAGPALSRKICVVVVDGQHQRNQPLGPVITKQPESFCGMLGQEAVFQCTALGNGPLSYQWYNGHMGLTGETNRELRLLVNVQNEGDYVCVVTDEQGHTGLTNQASLQVTGQAIAQAVFTATSKVALLIGNGTYKSERKLDAVYNDIPKLAHLLRNMGFKVVCCYDFTADEMKNAVTFLSSLMMKGVYAFAYFVGHGFYYQGFNYLLAADAHANIKPDEDAICIEWVLELLQKKSPAMKAIFLDICRVPPKTNLEMEPAKVDPRKDSNTIICYATGAYGKSFEVHNDDPHSFFVTCLLRALLLKEPVEFVGFRVKQIMGELFTGEQLQYPTLETNLAEARSLWDGIMHRGMTAEFNANIMQWESANTLPPPLYLNIDKINLRIHLDFEATVTNQFRVFVTIMQDNVTQVPYLAYIADDRTLIPLGVNAKCHVVPVSDIGMKRTVTVFTDLQKLQDELKVHLLLVSLPSQHVKVDYVLSFGMPMISNIRLWQSPQVFAEEILHMKNVHYETKRRENERRE